MSRLGAFADAFGPEAPRWVRSDHPFGPRTGGSSRSRRKARIAFLVRRCMEPSLSTGTGRICGGLVQALLMYSWASSHDLRGGRFTQFRLADDHAACAT